MRVLKFLFSCILLGISISGICNAQQFVYRPINPSFIGGDYYNGSWLLAEANAQNNISESLTKNQTGSDPLQDFSTSLTRSILTQLSKKILSDYFGENSLAKGTYSFGSYEIEVSDANDGVSISIYDTSSGNSTDIFVPYF